MRCFNKKCGDNRNNYCMLHGTTEACVIFIPEAEKEVSVSSRDCRGIPDDALCFFNNGTDEWACVNGDFISQAESPIGFGKDFEEAMADFSVELAKSNVLG